MTPDRTFYLALSPWLCFVIGDRTGGVGPVSAAAFSAAVAAVIVYFDRRHDRRPVLGLSAAAFFSLLAVTAESGLTATDRYDRTMAVAFLAAIFAVSLGRDPVTELYGRSTASRRQRQSPGFRLHHCALTRRWAVMSLVVAASLAIGAGPVGPLDATAFNWLIPLAAVLYAAVATPAANGDLPVDAGALAGTLEALLSARRERAFKPRLLPGPDREATPRRDRPAASTGPGIPRRSEGSL